MMAVTRAMLYIILALNIWNMTHTISVSLCWPWRIKKPTHLRTYSTFLAYYIQYLFGTTNREEAGRQTTATDCKTWSRGYRLGLRKTAACCSERKRSASRNRLIWLPALIKIDAAKKGISGWDNIWKQCGWPCIHTDIQLTEQTSDMKKKLHIIVIHSKISCSIFRVSTINHEIHYNYI